MSAPAVTVAIPSYNRPTFLRAALASVLEQDLEDFQVLVVDDASPCDIAAVVESFGDPRIRLIRQRTNVGVISNTRTALCTPQTRYVAHLDDDDVWLPHHLWEAVSALDAHPDASFYACTAQRFGQQEGLHRPYWITGETLEICRWQDTGYGVWLPGSCIPDSSVVVRRSALDDLFWGGRSWPWCHDWLWWGQLALRGPFLFEPTIGVLYRWHSSNFTSRMMSNAGKAQWLFTLRELARRAWRAGALRDLEAETCAFSASALSTVVVALTAPGTPPGLRSQALRIFAKRRDIASMPGCAAHYRAASVVGAWWLRYADLCTRLLGWWWPNDAASTGGGPSEAAAPGGPPGAPPVSLQGSGLT